MTFYLRKNDFEFFLIRLPRAGLQKTDFFKKFAFTSNLICIVLKRKKNFKKYQWLKIDVKFFAESISIVRIYLYLEIQLYLLIFDFLTF